ncbi:response regulator [Salipiger sp. P9]|uniref:response regulator n=1 Tax=Salipiger pentaromativorans TaxID=2943193 RepID=UPI0021581B97|nr:response regulator [Salipiger pentaromativorans]MCR8549118.1 response regulator [Salipiger pentaromativorans]
MARLLLADDDPDYCAAFRAGMTALGHEVETAETGDEAVDMLAQAEGGFDLVFLDVVMSGGGAVSTLHRIRDLWGDIPVVVITGRTELVDSPIFTRGLQSAQRRLRKSTKLRDLDAVVTELLSG